MSLINARGKSIFRPITFHLFVNCLQIIKKNQFNLITFVIALFSLELNKRRRLCHILNNLGKSDGNSDENWTKMEQCQKLHNQIEFFLTILEPFAKSTNLWDKKCVYMRQNISVFKLQHARRDEIIFL